MKQSHIIIVLAIVGIALAVLTLRRSQESFSKPFPMAALPPWDHGPAQMSRPPNFGVRPRTRVIVQVTRGKPPYQTKHSQLNVYIGKGEAGIMQKAAYLKLKAAFRGYQWSDSTRFINEVLLKNPRLFDAYKQLYACVMYRIEKRTVTESQMKSERGIEFLVRLGNRLDKLGWQLSATVQG